MMGDAILFVSFSYEKVIVLYCALNSPDINTEVRSHLSSTTNLSTYWLIELLVVVFRKYIDGNIIFFVNEKSSFELRTY